MYLNLGLSYIPEALGRVDTEQRPYKVGSNLIFGNTRYVGSKY